MSLRAEFHAVIYRLLTGRLFLFGALLVCTVPLAALSPVLWNDPTVTPRFAWGYTIAFGGQAGFYLYGYWYNWWLRRHLATISVQTVTGAARKVVQHFRMPIHAGGTTIIGPNVFKMCQFLIIEKKRYAVPLWSSDFGQIPTDQPVRLTFVELGGPLIIKLRRIVLRWEPVSPI